MLPAAAVGAANGGQNETATEILLVFGGRCLLQVTSSPGGTNCNSSSFVTMLHQNVQTIKSVFFLNTSLGFPVLLSVMTPSFIKLSPTGEKLTIMNVRYIKQLLQKLARPVFCEDAVPPLTSGPEALNPVDGLTSNSLSCSKRSFLACLSPPSGRLQ